MQEVYSREQFCRRLEQKWTSDKPIVRSFVFLGYPGEESSAIQIIKASLAKMVKEYGFQVKDWQDISDQGNIDQQLLTTIQGCLCGIFYLSQKDETFNGKAKFRCNHNVFFEAGIMSGKSNNFNNVILISEENRYHIEEEMPFDTKSIRQIIVRRTGPEHTIDSERLEREIENQIRSFFNKLDSNNRQ